jgi:hypothetical protein
MPSCNFRLEFDSAMVPRPFKSYLADPGPQMSSKLCNAIAGSVDKIKIDPSLKLRMT